ncbi:unnamed protein product [Absidia cylindrospora]
MQTSSSDSFYYPSTFSDSLALKNGMLDQDSILFDKSLTSSPPSTMFMKRSSLSKAERRAEHNAIERARRENLNGKFQQLAESLPNLQNYRRPSKGQIVEKALDWVRQSISKEERYQYQIHQLQRENKQLLMQLNLHQQQQDGQLTPPHLMNAPTSSPPNHQYQQQPAMQKQHSSSIIMPPQLTASPYSIGTNSRRGSSFMEDEDEHGDLSSMENYSLSTMMPVTTTAATMAPDLYFYNGLSPSPMDTSSWTKMNASSTPALIHPTDLSF